MFRLIVLFVVSAATVVAQTTPGVKATKYLFVWAGDDAKKSNDFLAVIDADPTSSHYGHAVASVAVPGAGGTPHHTELSMPRGGHLLANQHESGGTVLFDVNDPKKPKILKIFGDLDGYVHPHTYIRMADGTVLATFQYGTGTEHATATDESAHGHHSLTKDTPPGGIVRMTESGKVLKSGSAADATAKDELIRPYSLVALPKSDRVVSTSTAMHQKEPSTRTIQIWRLRDLKLLKTIALADPSGGKHNELPGEPVLAQDGRTVLVHTFTCGLYELAGAETVKPQVRQRKIFDAGFCGVPLRIGHYWIATLFDKHAVAVYDLKTPEMKEVSRVTFDDRQKPHWLSVDVSGKRIVMNSGEYGEHRVFMLDFDPATGVLKVDENFRDDGSDKPGVSMDAKQWPHGFAGDAYPHGAVLSR